MAREQDCSDLFVVALLAHDALGDSRVILSCTFTNNVLQDERPCVRCNIHPTDIISWHALCATVVLRRNPRPFALGFCRPGFLEGCFMYWTLDVMIGTSWLICNAKCPLSQPRDACIRDTSHVARLKAGHKQPEILIMLGVSADFADCGFTCFFFWHT